jgi:hypothetical protein
MYGPAAVTATEFLDDDFPLRNMDAARPWVIAAFGTKGTGKSVFSRSIFHSWPGDKVCIDVNGNAGPGDDAERVTLDQARAGKWPEQTLHLGERQRPRNLHFRAHPMAATYREDLDRAVGMALFPQRRPVLLWAGEVGELMPNGRPGRHMRTLLMQNRHHHTAVLMDGPRPVYVDPLVISQADLVACYRLPNEDDRHRVAKEFGCDKRKFDAFALQTWRRSKHAFVLCDKENDTLWSCPPLPIAGVDTKGAAA